MRILMISPQPFFESRGAPFCVYQHIKALTTLGYEVDLVTYPIGQDVQLPGLRIFRAPGLPGLRGIKPGPSLAKFPLDIVLFFTAFWQLFRQRYAYLHTHEEAGMMGVLLAKLFGGKHLYYMHSDLSQVVTSSDFTRNRLLLRCVEAVQRFMLRKANGVITFYPEIEQAAERTGPGQKVYMILPPAVDEDLPPASEDEVTRLREDLQLGDGPVLLYTGTLENYQGIDILLHSVAPVCAEFPTVRYIIVGGRPEQVVELQRLANELGVAKNVFFAGQRPLAVMPCYMALADVLLSPRSKGTHTPLKLYTYLRSGKPMLATSILAHTQILTPDIAWLVEPTPEGLTEGTLALLHNRERAQALGQHAQQVAEQKYSWSAFLAKNRQVYREFMGPASATTGGETDADEIVPGEIIGVQFAAPVGARLIAPAETEEEQLAAPTEPVGTQLAAPAETVGAQFIAPAEVEEKQEAVVSARSRRSR